MNGSKGGTFELAATFTSAHRGEATETDDTGEERTCGRKRAT